MQKSILLSTLESTVIAAGREIACLRAELLKPDSALRGINFVQESELIQKDIVAQFSTFDVRVMAKHNDEFGIMGEMNRAHKRSEYELLISPLPDASAFVSPLHDLCISLAITKNQRPVLGVVYVPMRHILYGAQQGKGAYVKYSDGSERRVHTKIPTERMSRFQSNSVALTSRAASTSYVRNMFHSPDDPESDFDSHRKSPSHFAFANCAALSFCQVAEGKSDCGIELSIPHLSLEDQEPCTDGSPLFYWDLAAADIILSEAGGTLTDFKGHLIRYGSSPDRTVHDHVFASGSAKDHEGFLESMKERIKIR